MANGWYPVIGAPVVWSVLWLLGLPLSAPSDLAGAFILLLATLGSAWIIIFAARLFWWPWARVRSLENSKPIGPRADDTAEWLVYGDLRKPKSLGGSFEMTWYFMNTVVSQSNKETGKLDEWVVVSFLFLMFEAPPQAVSADFSSPDMTLPIHQVEFFGPRGAIISFDGKIPAGTLEMRLL